MTSFKNTMRGVKVSGRAVTAAVVAFVLTVTAPGAWAVDPSPSASPSASASPSVTVTPSPLPSVSPSGEPSVSPSVDPSPSVSPSPSPSPSVSDVESDEAGVLVDGTVNTCLLYTSDAADD